MLRILPLGGLGEIGKNCMVLEAGGEAIIVDCGVTFGGREFGVDVTHPAFDWLHSYKGKLRGVVLTHGHEDHIGAVPYLLREIDVPVYGPPYAMSLLDTRADDHPVLRHARLQRVEPGAPIKLGDFRVTPIRVTHSIADATALAIDTPEGLVVHTGDFKIDDGGFGQQQFDMEGFKALGKRGVELLMSDSTNVERSGQSTREVDVHLTLEDDITRAKGAVFVGFFSSNTARLDALGRIADRTGRKLVLLGRGMQNHAKVARSHGFLSWSESRLWPADRVAEVPREKLLIVCTGTQAEPGGALGRLAAGTHKDLDVRDGDTVIFSSRVIPGHEPEVDAMTDGLIRRGARVLTPATHEGRHASGHATRSEQAQMLELCAPRCFLPLHGRLRHLSLHAELARQWGAEACVIENGTEARLSAEGLAVGESFSSGVVRTWDKRAVSAETLSTRRSLGFGGVVVVGLRLTASAKLLGIDDIVQHGVCAEKDELRLREEVRRDVLAELSAVVHRASDAEIEERVSRAVRRASQRVLGFRPEVLTNVVRAER